MIPHLYAVTINTYISPLNYTLWRPWYQSEVPPAFGVGDLKQTLVNFLARSWFVPATHRLVRQLTLLFPPLRQQKFGAPVPPRVSASAMLCFKAQLLKQRA